MKAGMNFKNHYLILLLLIFTGCSHSNKRLILLQSIEQHNIQSDKHTLIVFVHGTILPLPSPSCLFSSLKDGFKKSRREKKAWADYYYDELRYKTFFKCQPIANWGLETINELSTRDTQKYPYATRSADLYKNSYNFANQNVASPEKQANLHFYTFGWDGRLSQKSRINSAKTLYKSLLTEMGNLKSNLNLKDQDLELILIGHSHGGNVLLNLAKVEDKVYGNLKVDKLKVDKLILLGTPVQSETAELINSAMFNKIYSFYSTNDMIQVIDIISTQDDISKRRYKNTDEKSKLVQIELEIGTKKPLHNELWLFGDKSNIIYRSKLAINPLPAFVFLPVIINEIESKHPGVNELLVNIDKDKINQCFTVKLKDKTVNQNQTLTSIPTQIVAFNNVNPDK